MRHVIVVVAGPTRSGKDTLIDKTTSELVECNISILSSITDVKDFVADICKQNGWPAPDQAKLTYDDRQMYASIKSALDAGLRYTVNLPFSRLVQTGEEAVVLFYQVRETSNMTEIKAQAKAAGVGFLSVFVRRDPNSFPNGLPPQGAKSDQYKTEEVTQYDRFVYNEVLSDLDDWAIMLASKIRKLRDQ